MNKEHKIHQKASNPNMFQSGNKPLSSWIGLIGIHVIWTTKVPRDQQHTKLNHGWEYLVSVSECSSQGNPTERWHGEGHPSKQALCRPWQSQPASPVKNFFGRDETSLGVKPHSPPPQLDLLVTQASDAAKWLKDTKCLHSSKTNTC